MKRSHTILVVFTLVCICYTQNGFSKIPVVIKDSVIINEMEIIDMEFYIQLDSLIKFEKKCSHSSLKELHWVFSNNRSGGYKLTATSGFGLGKTHLGYSVIDSSIVFFETNEPKLYGEKKLEKRLTYVYTKRSLIDPEDYSVWIFKFINERLKIVKSYTLPCD